MLATTGGGGQVSRSAETPAAARPASLNVQASRSPDTFAAEIAEPGAFLVLAMSPFGYGHDPEGAAAPGNVVLTGAGLPLPQAAAASRVTETNIINGTGSLAPKHAPNVGFALIWLTALR